ncbi:putative baseplate assembly protein [Listeria phage LMTA-34]|uniref:Putative baseplate assembly protein n=1 Tax=Listeria phage LMTA-34 TaxID=1486397 RepID=A0A076G794_9CAUD|nr:putative baseplate assembly protein [Listeria phage LMTA-34]
MRLKRISEILSRLIDKIMINTSELNDFSVGSTILSILEAVSMELEQYYILSRENIVWGIQQGVFQAFDFFKREPKRAYGDVLIEFHSAVQSDVYIPKGTTFSSTINGYDQQFETVIDYYVPKDSILARVEVYCKVAGEIGNVPAGTINLIMNSVSNVKSVINESNFQTGTDEESLESVKNRFHAFVESRGRATVPAINYGTRLVEEVSGVYVKEYVGYVIVYAHDRNGNLSVNIQDNIKIALEDYRPAGIKLDVKPVNKRLLPVEVTVTITNKNRIGDTLQAHIQGVITDYLNSMQVSNNLILSELIQIIMSIDDSLIYDCKIENFTENVIINSEDIIRAGEVKVNLK